MKKILKVEGILPACDPFKIRVKSVVTRGNTSLFVASGKAKDIEAYASVNDDVVTMLTPTEAENLISSWKLPTTATCPTCGQKYTIPPIDIGKFL